MMKPKTAEGRRPFGSLAVYTNKRKRSMTLRPHLAMGLPFRGELSLVPLKSKSAITLKSNQYYNRFNLNSSEIRTKFKKSKTK